MYNITILIKKTVKESYTHTRLEGFPPNNSFALQNPPSNYFFPFLINNCLVKLK